MPRELKKHSVETFRNFHSVQFSLGRPEPEAYCFNGIVSIRKVRVTVEEIEEPKEVLEARLKKLWAECDNMHHFAPLRAAAKELGIELDHDLLGKKRKKH